MAMIYGGSLAGENIICEQFSLLDREPMSAEWLRDLMMQTEAEELRDNKWKVVGKWAAYYIRFVDGVLRVDVVSSGLHTVARIEGDQARGELFLNMLEIPVKSA